MHIPTVMLKKKKKKKGMTPPGFLILPFQDFLLSGRSIHRGSSRPPPPPPRDDAAAVAVVTNYQGTSLPHRFPFLTFWPPLLIPAAVQYHAVLKAGPFDTFRCK